ncbi:Oidioi.mRNA.OKI2018_I69.chr1.g609.t1.cds [Oikopleura dioica]|uniref:Nucleolar protein 12 n=1 Tax=Oikopleura dioica TaxID=34765 RepID=A0ABN7SRN4_OIKDI|nr:Oidioi.mRNA.OKI2018_I69.chr1.g609.t1.cds [Oikopleura dioica]
MVKKTGRRKKELREGADLVLSFDPAARKEFLTGFRKRKLARKAKAREELNRQIQTEKQRINKEKREEIKQKNELLEKYVDQFTQNEDESEEEFDNGEQTVVIKKTKVDGDDIDFEDLQAQSAAALDGLKAKQRKKNDFNRKKLKELEAKKHSLVDRQKAKKDPKLRKHVKPGSKQKEGGKGGKVEKRGGKGKKGRK